MWAQTKPGADAPRRLGPPRGWSLGREEKAPGPRPGLGERLGRPPCGLLGVGGTPDRVGAALAYGPTSSSRAATGWARARLRKGECVGGLTLGAGLRDDSVLGVGAGLWWDRWGPRGPPPDLHQERVRLDMISLVADTYDEVCPQVVCGTCWWWHIPCQSTGGPLVLAVKQGRRPRGH